MVYEWKVQIRMREWDFDKLKYMNENTSDV